MAPEENGKCKKQKNSEIFLDIFHGCYIIIRLAVCGHILALIFE